MGDSITMQRTKKFDNEYRQQIPDPFVAENHLRRNFNKTFSYNIL